MSSQIEKNIDSAKRMIDRLVMERDLYRARAIDEVMDHHNTDKLTATLDVDTEVFRNVQ